MQPSAFDRVYFQSLKRDLVAATRDVFRVPDSQVNESFARGFGVQTYAALIAALDGDHPRKQLKAPGVELFDHAAFAARMTELADERIAESVSAILEGARIDIKIVRRSPARQNPVRYSDIAYDVTVAISGVPPEVLELSPEFLIPEFFGLDGTELYRLDCDWSFRVDGEYAITRKQSGQGLLNSKIVDGRWKGGLYIYSLKHQEDDARCLRSVKAALARAMLPALTSRVRCSINQPDRYQYGAWRVRITIGPVIQGFLGGSRLVFALPKLPKRLVVMDKGCMFDVGVGVFQNGEWSADIYSNGIPEDKNPTGIAQVKAELLQAVNQALQGTGFTVRARERSRACRSLFLTGREPGNAKAPRVFLKSNAVNAMFSTVS
ncbi:conserved hypothetical protein [Paraburkholderia piptadeniae]|uniref:Uncharacterized protein n=2 Tax=Paraburkholderia TaxID=1822464 RepID=A0A7X1TLL1_9BURK|nr:MULTISPECIES: hypothetical protein [Paraburkholderia]MPW23892.1 hypothetical protein [Paraburkholderia franconis]SIT51076.1 conserved hypothetical protein [Paraburkholderia piptadeniae]